LLSETTVQENSFNNGILHNVITNYGQLSIADCISHAATYISTETRKSQDSIMLFQFLRNSLTDEARLLMMADEDVYTIAGEADGMVFFKLIVGRASIDTNAKVNTIRQKIAQLKVMFVTSMYMLQTYAINYWVEGSKSMS
jgi:hypothetical protein